MKVIIKTLLFVWLIVSCIKEDINWRPNMNPEAFNLLTIENQNEDVEWNTTFTWQPTTDADDDTVV